MIKYINIISLIYREKEIIEKKPTKYDYAKEKQEKIVPKEVEIPLDFDGDKSPQATKSKNKLIARIGPYVDGARETDENQESIDQIIAETISNIHILIIINLTKLI